VSQLVIREGAMMRSTALVLALLLDLAAAAGAQSKPVRSFTFILDFLPDGEYAPYYTALDKGWYREEGLDVKILRGAGSGDTIKRIAVGQGDTRVDKSRDVYTEYMPLKRRVPADELYTNDLLPERK
jgi:ABC-type nitrate/sulfonate/bicarbonate transport system substrate-binding protein